MHFRWMVDIICMTFSGKCMGFVCELKKIVFARTHVSYHQTDNLKIQRLKWTLN